MTKKQEEKKSSINGFRIVKVILKNLFLFACGKYGEEEEKLKTQAVSLYAQLLAKKFRMDHDINDNGVKVIYEDESHRAYAEKNKKYFDGVLKGFEEVVMGKWGKYNPDLLDRLIVSLKENLSNIQNQEEVDFYLESLKRTLSYKESAKKFLHENGLD